MWMRKYPRMSEIASIFGIPVSCVHRTIHKILPILHVVIVPKYVQWHNPRKWLSLTGTIPQWPHVVAILDGTPFRISRPSGKFAFEILKVMKFIVEF